MKLSICRSKSNLNPTGISMYYKKKTKKTKNIQTKQNYWHVFEKHEFPQTSLASSTLIWTLINKDSFSKKIALPILLQMPPWWPLYLFWGLSNSNNFRRFLLKLVLNGYAHPPKSQTFIKKMLLLLSKSLDQIFFLPLMCQCLQRQRTHRGNHRVKQSGKKLYRNILMRVTCLGFFNIQKFCWSWNFSCFWYFF